jgi:MerR family transcriptional regulator, thiopeptide resistance regulator
MEATTAYSVGDLARLSGVTVRTLHHYDRIGLLVPSGRSAAGYREYSTDDAERLGQILAYRACGLELAEIGSLLSAEGTDRSGHLRRLLGLLDDRMARLAEQRRVLAAAVEASEMGISLGPEEMLEVFGEHDPMQHAQEASDRWGDTDAYRESHRRTSSYTKQDWVRIREQSAEIESELAACLAAGEPADGARAKAAAEAHRCHIDEWYYPCSHEMQSGLADMYVADPRFRDHYDGIRAGLAEYVRDAIIANALDHIA